VRTSPVPVIGHWRWNLRSVQSLADRIGFGIACTVILFASVVEPPNEFSVSIWLNNINQNIKPHKNMSTKTPECWASDPQARGLRIEATPERSLLLPHNHFIFAELDSGGDEQNLKLVFTTHEISVRGHHLRRIETVMQRMELSLLAKLPSDQRNLITEGQPVILEIVVAEANAQEPPPPIGSK
jgi:hypothetical protein